MISTTRRSSRYFTYIQPLTKLPIVRSYGAPILTIAALSVFIIFAIKPTVTTILVLQKKLVNSQEVLTKITTKAQNLSQAKKNLQNLDPTITAQISTKVPDQIELKSLIDSLQASVKSHQASVSALQIQPFEVEPKQKATTKLTEVSFTFNIEGAYEALTAILEDLNKSPRSITIDNLILNKAAESKTILMSIRGKAYYLK